jgi:hypothetical protein
MTAATYYRGPDEPGGSGEILAEVVEGKLRRRIERDGQSIRCIGYDEHPVDIDTETVADYVWTIERQEFESEWRRYCGPTRHAPMFWFPRDCPRGCIWPVATTTAEDRESFFGQSAATRIHVMEAGWLSRMRECRLYAYRFPAGPFRPHEVGGYWVTGEQVDAVEQVIVDDLVGRHATAGVELRITPSIWPFWRQVASSTVGFSGSRLRNSAPLGRVGRRTLGVGAAGLGCPPGPARAGLGDLPSGLLLGPMA